MTRTLLAALASAAALTAAAQAPAPTPRVVNLKGMGCEAFLKLHESERSAVVWYISGDFREAGRTAARFDLDLAVKAVPEVVGQCSERPQASLTYTVVSWFKAHAPKPEKRAKGQARAK